MVLLIQDVTDSEVLLCIRSRRLRRLSQDLLAVIPARATPQPSLDISLIYCVHVMTT